MTKEEFLEKLRDQNLDAFFLSEDDPVSDGLGIRKVYYRWEIFCRERGQEYNTRGFPSESDALQALYEEISHIKSL